jgi:alpha-ketoglutarate-dependent taurine dioxygenase
MSVSSEQRTTDILAVPDTLRITEARLDSAGQQLRLGFAGESAVDVHETVFESRFLFQNVYKLDGIAASTRMRSGPAAEAPADESFKPFHEHVLELVPGLRTDPAASDSGPHSRYATRSPWSDAALGHSPDSEQPAVSAASLDTHAGRQAALHKLISPGYLLVGGVHPSEEATHAVAKALFGRAQQTLYGQGMWRTEVRPAGGNDTAYTAEALPLHMDGCYMGDQPGFQMFHCLKAAPDGGGMSTLADGLSILDALRQDHKDTFEYFCRPDMRLPYHHTDAEERQLERRPILTRHTGVSHNDLLAAHSPTAMARLIRYVHYNDIDRAPLSAATAPEAVCADMPGFYRHWKTLMRATNSATPQMKKALQPGTVLVFDNQRLLHGRTAFSSKSGRVLVGCYGSRADFESRLRQASGYPAWSWREADERA